MNPKVPIAIVGAAWRSASTELRARLAAIGDKEDPTLSILRSGYASGAAMVTTCSRTEWILASEEPEWAAALLKSALMARFPELSEATLHVRAGGAAVHYLLRVALGLDSVAEGEGAVGRQFIRAFAKARERGATDRRMTLAWKHLERLISARRMGNPAPATRGVQSLVRDALVKRGVRRVAVVGRGDFGQAMERALRGTCATATFARTQLGALEAMVDDLDAVVLCTGASERWFKLPATKTAALCIDAGAPPQLAAAPGWTTLGLDDLLAGASLQLGDAEREHLDALVRHAADALIRELIQPPHSVVLAAIDSARSEFLNDTLPGLLEGLPRDRARKVQRAVGAFAHRLLRKSRELPQ